MCKGEATAGGREGSTTIWPSFLVPHARFVSDACVYVGGPGRGEKREQCYYPIERPVCRVNEFQSLAKMPGDTSVLDRGRVISITWGLSGGGDGS